MTIAIGADHAGFRYTERLRRGRGRSGAVIAWRSVGIAVSWIVGSVLPAAPGAVHAQAPTLAQQIAAAVLPLPAALRAGAGVVRLDDRGHPEEWRPSRNGMVCLADEPGDSTFDVRCYHASFIPLLYRARQLAAADTPDSLLEAAMDREIHGGKLRLPSGPTAGYRMLGPASGFDWATTTASDTIDAWQSIHFPYRTAAELGLPTKEHGIHPYVMASGTWWSHVMIMERALRY